MALFNDDINTVAKSQMEPLAEATPVPPPPASSTRELRGRDFGQLVPSGAELLRLYTEQEQRKKEEQLRRNAALKAAQPQVFHMASVPVTPMRPCGSDACDSETSYDGDWNRACQGMRRRGREAQVRSNKPLTVPCGPRLRTAERSRSTSRHRSVSREGSPAGSEASSRAGSRAGSGRWEKSLRTSSVRSTPRSTRGTPRHDESTPRTRSVVRDLLAEDAHTSSEARTGSVGRTPRFTPVPTPRSALSQATASVCGRSHSVRSLSVSSAKHRQSSRDQREELEMREGRQRLSAMIRRNEVSCYTAIHCPDVHRIHLSTSATIPKEFHLSSSLRGRSRSLSVDSNGSQTRGWSASLRQSSVSREASPARSQTARSQTPTRPRLTMPCGPRLLTAQRQHSMRSLTRGGLGPHAAAAPAAPAAAAAAAAALAVGVPGPRPGESAADAAERARALAQAKTDEAQHSIKDKLFVFKKEGMSNSLRFPRGGA